MNDTAVGEMTPRETAIPRGALGAWWAQGARSIVFQSPDWGGLQLTPAVLAILWLLPAAFAVGVERLGFEGPATFYWPALLTSGWMHLMVWLLVSWWLVLGRPSAMPGPRDPPALLAMLCAQTLPMQLVLALVLVPFMRNGAFAEGSPLLGIGRAVWIAGLFWMFAVQGVLLWRASVRRPLPWVLAMGAIIAVTLLELFYSPLRHWYPERVESTAEETAPRFRLTQEVIEAQGQVLAQDLQALKPQRRGHIDLFAITYAPNAAEDVFSRESALVAGVMRERFDAAGHTLELVSRHDQAPRNAWATPLNLQRAIARMAALMNRDEDVLFLHLTSHGARNGELASSMWPLDVDALTPQQLKKWLDDAGIRHRVISISACYSGSWIAPLSGDDTLIMTAADAEHTSYGCGRHSELTYFGRAMFGEQLRRTLSFEDAHASARTVIEQREKEAKKTDGFSNPQISVGTRIRETLARLVAQLSGV